MKLLHLLGPRRVSTIHDAARRTDVRHFYEVLGRAEKEARRLRSPAVSVEHALLALLQAPDGEPARIVRALGLRPDWVRRQIREALTEQAMARPPAEVGVVSWLVYACESAVREAAALGQPPDERHLLIGVIALKQAPPAKLLRRLGVDVDEAAEQVRAIVAGDATDRVTLHITIDDQSDRLIYQQIVTQVEEAAATGQVAPGDRLPTVRQLADELGIAPGTVARAYGELEQSGVIRTEGARGTFVAERDTPASAPQRPGQIQDMLRPIVVAAYHQGASADELRTALERAMMDIYRDGTAE